MANTDSLRTKDLVQDSTGYHYRVRDDGRYDALSELQDDGTTPVVDGDAVSWPVALLVRDGRPTGGVTMAVRMAMFLDARR